MRWVLENVCLATQCPAGKLLLQAVTDRRLMPGVLEGAGLWIRLGAELKRYIMRKVLDLGDTIQHTCRHQAG